MPGNIIPIQPTDVMPYNLSRAFREELRLEALINMYPDGRSDRQALALNVRHYFTLTVPLLRGDWTLLRTFFYDHQGKAFWFYHLRETVPPWTFDPTGQNPIGRYTVAFDGQWSDTVGMARSNAQIALREVQ
jgi:hypothetical protein